MAEEDAKREIAALEHELQRARQTAEKNHAALSALDEQRREREGRLAVALRAQHDFEQRLEEKRIELARAEAEAALAVVRQALEDRDAAADAFASAVQLVALRLQGFDAAQETAQNAWQALLSSRTVELPALVSELPDEDPHQQPEIVTQALGTLTELVKQRVDQELERDLIEAAARSPLGNDIANLPEHLRELARARFFSLARERRQS
ncbi:MAG: hypothetical protein QOG06_456 [Gaiellaceae bacterium]|jgi:chromosome segregation ATPase|nr:hypothetical protein [Gaiellaceae bacterium]